MLIITSAPAQCLRKGRPFRIPDIFTDIHPEGHPIQGENRRLFPRLEITIFIEDAIVRKVAFVVNEPDRPSWMTAAL